MILPLVALLSQPLQAPAAATQPVARPVRVWLDTSTPLTRGAPVRVYVQANEDGNLVVLRKTTDGRVRVLFPGHPTDDPFVRSGTYEIRAAGDRAAFVVAEPDGTGWVLAALSPGTLRFDEFVRTAAWDPDALVPSWSGADPEGALTDIVQRMLGDGYFSYDLATYTVAPSPTAEQIAALEYSPYATCLGCTFVAFQVISVESVLPCDAFFTPCFSTRRFHDHRSLCQAGLPCSGPGPTSTLALATTGPSLGPRFVPLRPRFVIPQLGASGPAIGPRSRTPEDGAAGGRRAAVPIAAIALRPGQAVLQGHASARSAIVGRDRAVAAGPASTSIYQVRLTLSPTAVREEPPARAVAHSGTALVAAPRRVGGTEWQRERARARGAVGMAAESPGAMVLVAPGSLVPPRSASSVGGARPAHTFSLPAAAGRYAVAHAATVVATGRRH